jgi:hypothetical protein
VLEIPTALVLSDQAMTRHLGSALPGAPVIASPPARPAPARRTRLALAGVLQRAAVAVAPPECSPAR